MTDSDILINDLEQGSRVRWAPGQHFKRPISSTAEGKIQMNRIRARVRSMRCLGNKILGGT